MRCKVPTQPNYPPTLELSPAYTFSLHNDPLNAALSWVIVCARQYDSSELMLRAVAGCYLQLSAYCNPEPIRAVSRRNDDISGEQVAQRVS